MEQQEQENHKICLIFHGIMCEGCRGKRGEGGRDMEGRREKKRMGKGRKNGKVGGEEGMKAVRERGEGRVWEK